MHILFAYAYAYSVGVSFSNGVGGRWFSIPGDLSCFSWLIDAGKLIGGSRPSVKLRTRKHFANENAV
jgi:hypothetical protein